MNCSDAGAGGKFPGAPAPTRGRVWALGKPGAGGVRVASSSSGFCCCCCWRTFTSLSPSDVATSFPHAVPSVSAPAPVRAARTTGRTPTPLSPMTSRTAFTTPWEQKHLASSAVPSARSTARAALRVRVARREAREDGGSRPPRRPSFGLARGGAQPGRAGRLQQVSGRRADGGVGEDDRGGAAPGARARQPSTSAPRSDVAAGGDLSESALCLGRFKKREGRKGSSTFCSARRSKLRRRVCRFCS